MGTSLLKAELDRLTDELAKLPEPWEFAPTGRCCNRQTASGEKEENRS
jgi:hypothetical protein